MPDDALREAKRVHRELLRLEARRTKLLALRKLKIREALADHMASDVARELGLSKGRLSQILTTMYTVEPDSATAPAVDERDDPPQLT